MLVRVGYRFGCPSVDSSIQLHGHMHSHGGRVSVVEEDEDVGAPLVMVNDDNDNCPNSAATRRLSTEIVERLCLQEVLEASGWQRQYLRPKLVALRQTFWCRATKTTRLVHPLAVFGSIVISSALLTAENSSDKCESTTS